MVMKREREVDSITMANYLMLLSRGSEFDTNSDNYLLNSSYYISNNNNNRVFECKTCNRQFSSFQALGGHRASHKKPRLMMKGSESSEELLLHGSSSPPKPKTHECSICGLEFAIGQALGGHMRRHRATASASTTNNKGNMNSSVTSTSSLDDNNNNSSENDGKKKKKANNISNNSSSSSKKRSSPSSVLFLDLNLTPFENDLEFLKIGQPTTTWSIVSTDCY